MPNSQNLRPISAKPGNRLGLRHGFYATALEPIENEEILKALARVEAELAEVRQQLASLQSAAR